MAEVLDNGGYDGNNFQESIKKAGRLIAPILNEVLEAHEVRNSIVYDPDYKLSAEQAKKILETYELAARGIGLGLSLIHI